MTGVWECWASECSNDGLLSVPLLKETPALATPQTWKGTKQRKTQDFISRERTRSEVWDTRGVQEDPLLAYDKDASRIHAKVASLIFRYVMEGDTSKRHLLPANDEFHEEHFLHRGLCRSFCCPRWCAPSIAGTTTSEDMVRTLVSDVATGLFFCNQIVVLSVVYIERLIKGETGGGTEMLLTSRNWRPILSVALLVASKVFEDVHPWNADFEECLREVAGMRCRRGSMTDLESRFLSRIGWRLYVDGEIYAAYFFSLLGDTEGADESRPSASRRSPRLRGRGRRPPPIHTAAGKRLGPATNRVTDRGPKASRHGKGITQLGMHSLSEGDEACTHSDSELEGGAPGQDDALGPVSPQQAKDAWRLDALNPLIGTLRHSPPALSPSPHIENCKERLLARDRMAKSADMFFGHLSQTQLLGRKGWMRMQHMHNGDDGLAAYTLSGATGARLAAELHSQLGVPIFPGGAAADGSATSSSLWRGAASIPGSSMPSGASDSGGPLQSRVLTWNAASSYRPPSLRELPPFSQQLSPPQPEMEPALGVNEPGGPPHPSLVQTWSTTSTYRPPSLRELPCFSLDADPASQANS